MANADLFRQLGLFVARDFFDAAACAELRAAASAATSTAATVYDGTDRRKLDATTRRTLRPHVDADILTRVTSRIMAMKPAVERHFQLVLTTCSEPQFLVYRVGDFFAAHADGGDDPADPEGIRLRKVSLVIFLSGEAPGAGPGFHRGGSLTFYDLMADPKLSNRGLPLTAEPGMVVAFPASTVHAVSPVVAGERYTIVSWFV